MAGPKTGQGNRDRLIDRRAALTGIVTAGLAAGRGVSAPAHAAEPTVETTHGVVRGSSSNGIRVFKGVPYAASTAGVNRFRPPQPVEPWAGVRDTTRFGRSSPQTVRVEPLMSWYYANEPIGEDCLSLNVFAPPFRAAARRPVMVWLHGGGWWSGAGTAVDASNLAEHGDVVVVTINHRLNLFGYIRLDEPAERFADSGNAGVLDMVAALRWVRDNAAAFGGDPRNVTIFGQSGGGAKVSALMAAPAAKGLFHKAIAQSCSGALRLAGEAEAAALAHGLARQLGLATATGEALQAVPMDRLVAAMAATSVVFRPVLDGRTFTRHPFDPDAPPISRNIPFIAGNVATETTEHLSLDPRNFSLEIGEVRRRLGRYLRVDPEETDRILAAYWAASPAASPSDLLIAATTDYQFIRNTRREAHLQAASDGAPVYSYIFEWRTPVMGGLLKSPHAVDVPFVFGATAAAGNMVGNGPDLAPLSRTMMATWSAFAHTGDPNNALIPPWPAFDPKTRLTMMLDLSSRVERDPGGEARAALDALPFYEYSMPISFAHP